MSNSLSIFARALATENLSFAFDPNAETASFDVKNRHLSLPMWDVSETVQTMLIAHEISHALWTPYQESETLLAAAEQEGYNRMVLQRIANVVEDVRIEKMMKQKYPGTRRDFFLGYKEINDSDMFGFSKADFSKMSLVNRLNIHFKWGVPGFIDLNLSAEEQEIADMIDRVTDFSDVYEVAKILYDHPSMQEAVQQAQQQTQQTQGGGKDGNRQQQSALNAVANDVSDGIGKKDGDLFSASTVTIPVLQDYRKGIISTDTLLKQFDEMVGDPECSTKPLDLKEYRSFVKDSDAFVRQLAAQFDRRKAADEIRRERPKQTGMLNLDRLHQYRTHDDLFISKIVKQDGKNHGIVFLLDMSGSMSERIDDCFLQVLQLVWFCEKAKIPFEVFGFTDVHPQTIIGRDAYMKEYEDWRKTSTSPDEHFVSSINLDPMKKSPTGIIYGHTRLINLASSRDDAAKRERLLGYLYETWVLGNRQRPSMLSLHGTPTVEAVAIASHFMQDWVKSGNIQIPTIMVVTDGQPNGVYTNDNEVSCVYWHKQEGSLTVMNEVLGISERVMLADHKFTCLANLTISTMLNALRKTLNARIVGMFVDGNNLSTGAYTAFAVTNKEREEMHQSYRDRNEILMAPRFVAIKEVYKDGAFIAHPDCVPGYDSFFVVRTPKIVKDADAISESGTFTKIKNNFIKTMAKRSASRVFLTRYVDIVAGQKIAKDIGGEYTKPFLAPKK